MLQATDVSKRFGDGDTQVTAVNGVSLQVPDGAFVSIVGRSGSGKTTLMNLLGALEQPTSGVIVVDGQDIAKLSDRELVKYRAQEVGFVFQSYNLIPNLTAQENVMLPMEATGCDKQQRRERAEMLLNQVGVTGDKQHRKPGRLSGGEQQRVAIARALANKPRLILADEPTGNVDSQTSTMIVELLRDLSRSQHTTIVLVTHDTSIADQADKTFRLDDRKLAPVQGEAR